jgi:hypothetical protein
MDDGWMMDGWMAYSISPGWCVLDNGVLDVDGLYSTSSGLHSVTTGPERQRQGGLRAARGERAWMIYDIVAS